MYIIDKAKLVFVVLSIIIFILIIINNGRNKKKRIKDLSREIEKTNNPGFRKILERELKRIKNELC